MTTATLYRRSVEVVFTDGTKTIAKKQSTTVRAGEAPQPIRPEIAAQWKELYERSGKAVAKVQFRYRKA
jgi:hypothetical protein